MLGVIIMFLYIYEFNLSVLGLPTFLTTRRTVVFLLLVWFFMSKQRNNEFNVFKGTEIGNRIKKISKMQIFLLFYSFFLIALVGRGSGTHISDCVIRLLLFGLLPSFLFYSLIRDLDYFLKLILLATLVQSLFVIYSLIEPTFGIMLDATFSLDEDYVTRHRTGYACGLACTTAPGCLRFSMGLLAAAYFAIKNKRLFDYAIYIFLTLVATMIARTGLLFGSIGLFVIIIASIKDDKFTSLFTVFLPLILIGYFVVDYVASGGINEYFDFYRLKDLFESGTDDNFFQDYLGGSDTVIPPLSLDTIIGIGTTSGVSGSGIEINVDGGFIRLYAAYGLILAVIFYLNFFYNGVKICRYFNDRTVKMTLIYFLIIIFLGEVKEFTIYQQYMLSIFLAIAMLSNKKNNQIEI